MKKKGTQTVENTTEDELKPTEDELKPTEEELKRRRRQKAQLKLTAAAKKGKSWRRSAQNGPPEGQNTKTAPDDPDCGGASPEKEPRAHTRTHAPARGRRGCRRRHERDGAWDAGFRWGGHRRVDRPSTLRNLWFSAGEELPGKLPAAVTAAASDGCGGCGGEKEIRRRRRRSE